MHWSTWAEPEVLPFSTEMAIRRKEGIHAHMLPLQVSVFISDVFKMKRNIRSKDQFSAHAVTRWLSFASLEHLNSSIPGQGMLTDIRDYSYGTPSLWIVELNLWVGKKEQGSERSLSWYRYHSLYNLCGRPTNDRCLCLFVVLKVEIKNGNKTVGWKEVQQCRVPTDHCWNGG